MSRHQEEAPRGGTIRKVRSEHGTRVARSIQCSACGEKDTIHFAPKDPARVLCRRCAADKLGVDDPDTRVGSFVHARCVECGRTEETQDRARAESGYVCGDCRRGILSRQENKTQSAQRLSTKVLRVRRPQ